MEKAAGLDDGLDVLHGGLRQGGEGGVFRKKLLCYDVHPGVGTLRRQAGGDQKLVRVGVSKRADRIGIELFQRFHRFQ